jgi:hypothetical protein
MNSTTADTAAPPDARPGPGPLYYARKGLQIFASLRLTVVLFCLSIALIFFGTVAQMDNGVWTVVEKYFWSWVTWVPLELFNKVGQVFFDFPRDSHWDGSFPFPGGKLLGGAMLLNLLAAHLVRFKISWKRSGILLIHAGLILLFVGEFITREYAVEQRMIIPEGEAVNYTQDARKVELAFVDQSDPNAEKVAVIPESLLKENDGGGRISDQQLPVDVEVVEFMPNSDIEKVPEGEANRATHGTGASSGLRAARRREGSGVDTEAKVDVQAAYVRFLDKTTGKPLGTYLVVSKVLTIPLLEKKQEVTAGGKTYDVSLRPKRYYKPYTVYLVKFRFDRYLGTEKPKNYSSEVVVVDEDGYEQRTTIRMNEPLRHEGETFYQGGFLPDETTTILQVVKNPGWLIPYISCVMVTLGLITHFGIYLTQFLTRRRAAA